MITPSNWISFADSGSEFLKSLKNNGLTTYKFLGDKAFSDVQLITVYFVCSKMEKSPDVTIITENDSIVLSRNSLIYFPTKTNKALSIISHIETLSNNGLIGIKGNLDRNKTVLSDNTGVKCIFSAGRKGADTDWAYVSTDHLIKNEISGKGLHKVVVSRITSPGKLGEMKYADDNFSCAQGCYYFVVKDKTEADNFIAYCSSKIVKLIVSELKGAVCSNSQSIFEFIPLVDFTKVWTDSELYTHFKITSQSDIDYIEATVK